MYLTYSNKICPNIYKIVNTIQNYITGLTSFVSISLFFMTDVIDVLDRLRVSIFAIPFSNYFQTLITSFHIILKRINIKLKNTKRADVIRIDRTLNEQLGQYQIAPHPSWTNSLSSLSR